MENDHANDLTEIEEVRGHDNLSSERENLSLNTSETDFGKIKTCKKKNKKIKKDIID